MVKLLSFKIYKFQKRFFIKSPLTVHDDGPAISLNRSQFYLSSSLQILLLYLSIEPEIIWGHIYGVLVIFQLSLIFLLNSSTTRVVKKDQKQVKHIKGNTSSYLGLNSSVLLIGCRGSSPIIRGSNPRTLNLSYNYQNIQRYHLSHCQKMSQRIKSF